MIPNSCFLKDLEITNQPSKTYMMNVKEQAINGYCDELKAIEQAIYKILNTERYQYLIYSSDYGIETVDLYGEHVTYVCPELQRRISEALTQDDRILGVDAFSFDVSIKKKVITTFVVHTIFGDVNAEKEMDI